MSQRALRIRSMELWYLITCIASGPKRKGRQVTVEEVGDEPKINREVSLPVRSSSVHGAGCPK